MGEQDLVAELGRTVSMACFALSIVPLVWSLFELARLRRHPAFRSAIGGSLSLHLMALGLAPIPASLDATTRRRLRRLRWLFATALLLFAVACTALLTTGAATPPGG